MTLNDLWAIFTVVDFLNATKMTTYSFPMNPPPCRVAGCIIFIRPTYSCVRALTCLLTYLGSWLCAYKTGNISETVEDRANVTINGLYIKSYAGFRLPPKCMTMNDLWARFKVLDSLNAAKMTKYIWVMTPTPYIVAGCIISVRPMYFAPVHLLTLGVYNRQ